MTISIKANAAGTQGEVLLNGTPVQTFNQNTLQVSGNVLAGAAQSAEYNALTRKDYVDGLASGKVSKSGDIMSGGLTTAGLSVGSSGNAGISQKGTGITSEGTIELFGPSPFIDFKTTAVDNDYRILESSDKSGLNFQAPGGNGFALLQNGVVSFGMGILGFSYGGTEASGWINFPAWLGGYQFRFGSAVVTTNAGGGGYIPYASPFSSQSGVPIINYGDNGWIDNPVAPIQAQLDSGGFGFQALGGANITIRVNYFSIGR